MDEEHVHVEQLKLFNKIKIIYLCYKNRKSPTQQSIQFFICFMYPVPGGYYLIDTLTECKYLIEQKELVFR